MSEIGRDDKGGRRRVEFRSRWRRPGAL